MKIILLLSLFVSASAFGFEIGPAGVFSSYNATSYTQTSNGVTLSVTPTAATAFGGGLVTLFPLGPNFDLGIQALYVNQNIKATYTGTSITGTITSNAPFILIPATLNLHLGKMAGVHAGGFYGVGTGTTSTTNTTTILGVTSTTTTSSSNNTNDYGATAGILFKIPLSAKASLLISADYYYGLANLNSKTTGASSSTSQNIQGLAGVLFKM